MCENWATPCEKSLKIIKNKVTSAENCCKKLWKIIMKKKVWNHSKFEKDRWETL